MSYVNTTIKVLLGWSSTTYTQLGSNPRQFSYLRLLRSLRHDVKISWMRRDMELYCRSEDLSSRLSQSREMSLKQALVGSGPWGSHSTFLCSLSNCVQWMYPVCKSEWVHKPMEARGGQSDTRCLPFITISWVRVAVKMRVFCSEAWALLKAIRKDGGSATTTLPGLWSHHWADKHHRSVSNYKLLKATLKRLAEGFSLTRCCWPQTAGSNLRPWCPHPQKMEWKVFGHSVDYGCSSLYPETIYQLYCFNKMLICQ